MGKGHRKSEKKAVREAERDAGRSATFETEEGARADAKHVSAKASKPLDKDGYRERLAPLELRLNDVARWLTQSGRRLLVIVEGRDTAGKGGVIDAIGETLNPRQCRVVALGKPSDRERTQWYFQRYVPYLPAAGEIVLFDRSWYNRAGVERVMDFSNEREVGAFLRAVPAFERLLVDDGLLFFKYWLTVDQARQEERFAERQADPLKRWKLSPIDLQAREKYAAYGRARDEMLEATHTAEAPWVLVDFNDQRRGRITLIRHLLAHLPSFEAPETPIEFPSLAEAPERERYLGPLKPIPSAD